MNNNAAYLGAVAMAKRGIKVLPLTDYSSSKKGKEVWSKIPRVDNWPAHATTETETIKKWASGDFTGTSSKSTKPCRHFGGSLEGFIVFDIDAPEAKESLHNLFVSAGLTGITPTLTTRTGNGGSHFIYRQPAGYNLGNSVSKIAPKLDTRGGAGGYIVLPGTANPVNGNEYTILTETGIATLPAVVAELIKNKVTPGKTASTVGKQLDRREGSVPDTAAKIKAATDYLLEKEGGVEGAGGEADAVCVGRKLADIGLSEGRAIALAQALYSPKCAPTWDECPELLATKIRNGYRYRESEIGCEDPDLLVEMFKSTSGEATEEDWKNFPFKSMRELSTLEVPPFESLLDGFMAHGKYLSLWYGAGGSGKSLLSLQFLRTLTRNREFLGLKPGKVCRHFKGALVSLEEPFDDVLRRFDKQSTRIVDPLTDSGEEPEWVYLRGADPRICKMEKGNLVAGEGLDRLIRVVRSIKPTLLVIDSLSRIFPGNENDRTAVTAFGRIMDKLVEETGCHVLLLAHTNKAGVFSGSTGWEAICRQMYVITSEKLDGRVIHTLTAEKTNEGEKGAYIRYRFDDWYYVPVTEEEYNEAREVASRSKTSAEIEAAEQDLIGLLDFNGEMQYKDLQKQMRDAGHDKGAMDFAIRSAKARGRVEEEERYSPGSHTKRKFLRLVGD